MRYERKYELRKPFTNVVANYLCCHGFKEAYPKRIVNSLYYDDNSFSLFSAAQNGISSRKKVRVRFYNSGEKGCMIESKIKEGDLNYKKFANLNDLYSPTLLELNFQDEKLNYNIKVPSIIKDIYMPISLVTYKRNYFISNDENLRITLDTNVEFLSIKKNNHNIELDRKRSLFHDIIEMKYEKDFQPNPSFLNSLTQSFKLILTRSSKYCKSISSIYHI